MKPKHLFPAVAFALALVLLAAAYFLFWRKEKAARPEIIAQQPVPATIPQDTSQPEMDEEEEATEPPIPYVVRTVGEDKINDSVKLVHKKHFLPSQPDCENYSFEWTEIALRNKRVENRINQAILKEVQNWLEEENGQQAVPAHFCNSESSKEFVEILTVYGWLAHANFYLSEYFAGGAHPNIMVKTTCYDLKSGKPVNFHELIRPEKIAELDSLIVQSTNGEEGPWTAPLRQAYREQLPNLNFTLEKDGLQIIRRGNNYVTSVMPLELSRQQTEAYLKSEVYNMVYGTANSGKR